MNIVFKVLLLILLCSFITGLFVTLFELIKKNKNEERIDFFDIREEDEEAPILVPCSGVNISNDDIEILDDNTSLRSFPIKDDEIL